MKANILVYIFTVSLYWPNSGLGNAEFDAKFISFDSCPGFKNSFLIAELKVESDDIEIISLSGILNLTLPIDETYQILSETQQLTEKGAEPFCTMNGNICASLTDKDCPWSGLFQHCKWDKCPIKPEKCVIEDMKISLKEIKSFLNHELVAEYKTNMTFKKMGPMGLETVACYVICSEIYEIV